MITKEDKLPWITAHLFWKMPPFVHEIVACLTGYCISRAEKEDGTIDYYEYVPIDGLSY